MKSQNKKMIIALICGILGCFCYGGGDWLMMYGDPSHSGKLIWLTIGTAGIPQWIYILAMLAIVNKWWYHLLKGKHRRST